jgi:hypothetical protein
MYGRAHSRRNGSNEAQCTLSLELVRYANAFNAYSSLQEYNDK